MSIGLFPLERAEDYLHGVTAKLERKGSVLRWPSHDGVTELSVTETNERMPDGYAVSEVVTLTHTSRSLAIIPNELSAELNKWATLSAIVPSDSHGPTRLTSKVGIFNTDREAAERNYAPLICTEAAVIGWHAAMLARGQFEIDATSSPLMETDRLPPYEETDFAAVKQAAESEGLFCSMEGTKHFAVEFPWAPGAKSRLFASEEIRGELLQSGNYSPEDIDEMAGETSLLQMLVMDHPLYGKGLQCRLEIPAISPGTPDVEFVNALNAWELSGSDLPPLFGAWGVAARTVAPIST